MVPLKMSSKTAENRKWFKESMHEVSARSKKSGKGEKNCFAHWKGELIFEWTTVVFKGRNSTCSGLFLQCLEYHKPSTIMDANSSRFFELVSQVVHFIRYYSSTTCFLLGHVSIWHLELLRYFVYPFLPLKWRITPLLCCRMRMKLETDSIVL